MTLNYKYMCITTNSGTTLIYDALFHFIYLFNYLSVTCKVQFKAVCNCDKLFLL